MQVTLLGYLVTEPNALPQRDPRLGSSAHGPSRRMDQDVGNELRVCVLGDLRHLAIPHHEHPAVTVRVAWSSLRHAVIATLDDDQVSLGYESLGGDDIRSGELLSEGTEQLGKDCGLALVGA